MKKFKGFKLFECCKIVKGYNRSLIYDLQRESLHFITNDLFGLLDNHQDKTIAEVKVSYGNQFDVIIDEYFEFLISNELIYFTDTPEWFPKTSSVFYYPFEISNAIIDIDRNSNYDVFKILNELELINCKYLEIRCFELIEIEFLDNIFSYLNEKESIIVSISITIPFVCDNEKHLDELIKKHNRLSSLTISQAPFDKILLLEDNTNRYKVYTKNIINSEKCCGIINKSFFITNIDLFNESKSNNSCLNKKISIDVDGNIKNCPSLNQSFGNIKNTTLQEALEHQDFKKYWNITKDQIEVCKDCEFRYVCTDCRAYKENPEDDYSKPLKCGYSPYTNKWEEWSTNPLKEKAIEHYGMQEFVKKND